MTTICHYIRSCCKHLFSKREPLRSFPPHPLSCQIHSIKMLKSDFQELSFQAGSCWHRQFVTIAKRCRFLVDKVEEYVYVTCITVRCRSQSCMHLRFWDVKILSSVFSPLKLFGVFEEYSEYPSIIKYCHELSPMLPVKVSVSCI